MIRKFYPKWVKYSSEITLVVKPNAVANQHQILMRQSASASQEVSFQATVNFTPSLQSELSWSPTSGITSGKLIASGTLSVDLNAAYNFQAAASYNPTPVVLSTKTYTSLYFVGEVPVYQVVTLTITSKITASASAAINAVTDANATETVTVGANYNPATGQWVPNVMEPSQFDINFGVQSNISVNMSALWRDIKLLSPTTLATKTYPLLSLPSLQLQRIDSTTLKQGQAQTLTPNPS